MQHRLAYLANIVSRKELPLFKDAITMTTPTPTLVKQIEACQYAANFPTGRAYSAGIEICSALRAAADTLRKVQSGELVQAAYERGLADGIAEGEGK
jgi:hypothetical protein